MVRLLDWAAANQPKQVVALATEVVIRDDEHSLALADGGGRTVQLRQQWERPTGPRRCRSGRRQRRTRELGKSTTRWPSPRRARSSASAVVLKVNWATATRQTKWHRANEKVVDMVTWYTHSLALTEEGALFSFGNGSNGRLGHGDTADQPRPKCTVVGEREGACHDHSLTKGCAVQLRL